MFSAGAGAIPGGGEIEERKFNVAGNIPRRRRRWRRTSWTREAQYQEKQYNLVWQRGHSRGLECRQLVPGGSPCVLCGPLIWFSFATINCYEISPPEQFPKAHLPLWTVAFWTDEPMTVPEGNVEGLAGFKAQTALWGFGPVKSEEKPILCFANRQ
ncbi:unnamed protein product [Sphenostylis stenocarpa]|uniref:Uncharacterized protein n=1 Tax=Sphenostylis stenocarpa TaxID=92480 RepID=A0AA86SIH2_9FABA|nr:unnamed protein product [Sphenostylis stenocarpa]